MARTRDRRRRGQAIAKVRIDTVERQKLVALGYLDHSLIGDEKGPAIDAAVEAYLSDKLAEEPVALRCNTNPITPPKTP